MKSYGRKFIKSQVQKQIADKVESRNAIVWDIDPIARLARVKIQGSSQYVTVYYPENWEQTPFWLKPGNAVAIRHTGGIRGKIEIIGHGRCIPTAVSGGNLPDIENGPDAVLTGCNVIAIPNDPQMRVMVTVGTYRIVGVTYTLSEISMNIGDYFVLGMGSNMSQITAVKVIDAAPSIGYSRYDLIVVGVDGVIDYIKGTAFTTTEIIPSTPSGHLLLGKIFLYSGMTEIIQSNINGTYVPPVASSLEIDIADRDLSWVEFSTTVTVKVKDQNGNAINNTGLGWYILLSIVNGNGNVSSPEEGSSTTQIGGHTGPSSNQYIFTYTRNQLLNDVSPNLKATLETNYTIESYDYIILRDGAGNPM